LGTAIPGLVPGGNVLSSCFFGNDDLSPGDGLGLNFIAEDPLFVDPDARDFHLRAGSPCIDAGRGTDAIDDSPADIGAYGGPFADPRPFPIASPRLTDVGTAEETSLAIEWPANLDYRVTEGGGYRVHYERGGDGTPPLEGTDAGG